VIVQPETYFAPIYFVWRDRMEIRLQAHSGYPTKIVHGRVFPTVADACIWAAYRTLAMHGTWGDEVTVGGIAQKWVERWCYHGASGVARAIERRLDVKLPYSPGGKPVVRDSTYFMYYVTDPTPPPRTYVGQYFCCVCGGLLGYAESFVPIALIDSVCPSERATGCQEVMKQWPLKVKRAVARISGTRGARVVAEIMSASSELRRLANVKIESRPIDGTRKEGCRERDAVAATHDTHR